MQHIFYVTNLRTPPYTAILHEQKNKNKYVGVFVSFFLLAWQQLISADEQLHSFVDFQVLSQGE